MPGPATRFGSFLRRCARLRSVPAFFAGIFVVSQLSIQAVLGPIDPGTVLQLQTTFSADRFAALVAGLFEQGLVEHYIAHFYYDFLHPVWYGGLAALLAADAMNRNGLGARHDAWLAVPLLLVPLDGLENALHLYMVLDTANIGPGLVGLAGGASVGKWLVLVGTLVAATTLYGRWLVTKRQG